MVLKYKGFNNNWVFVEGKIITVATVSTEGIDTSSELPGTLSNCYKKLADRISKETGLDNFRWVGEVFMCFYVVVVQVGDETYVFSVDVALESYILNDNGKTVERLSCIH